MMAGKRRPISGMAKASSIAIVGLGAVIVVIVAALLWPSHKDDSASSTAPTATTPSSGATSSARPPATPIKNPPPRPPVRPPTPTPTPRTDQPIAIAKPPGTGETKDMILPAPRDQVELRAPPDAQTRPQRAVTPRGLQAASQALRENLARCFPGSPGVAVRFTLVAQNGRAQARDAQVLGAPQTDEVKNCMLAELTRLSWETPDPDGADTVSLPLRLK